MSYYGPSGGSSDRRGGGGRFGQGSRNNPPFPPGRSGGRFGAPATRGGRDSMPGGRGRGDRGGGRGRGRGPGRGESIPDLSTISNLMTNIVLATPSTKFSFYMYTTDSIDRNSRPIDSLSRRGELYQKAIWDTLLREMPAREKKNLEKVVFFQGSFFFSKSPIPGLEKEKLPRGFLGDDSSEGDAFEVKQVFHFTAPKSLLEAPPDSAANTISFERRCAGVGCNKVFSDVLSLFQHCRSTGHRPVYDPRDEGARPAEEEVFLAYCNLVLARALGKEFSKWGREYIDPQQSKEPTDRRGHSLGVMVYPAFACEFGLMRPKGPRKAVVALTIDLCAKLMRTQSVLDLIYNGNDPSTYELSPQERTQVQRNLESKTVVYKTDKKCYSVVAVRFDHSPSSLPVEGLGMSHAEYFERRKRNPLQYPNAKPILEVQGKRGTGNIFLPAELVCADELDARVKEQLPTICSFDPATRNEAIETIKAKLKSPMEQEPGTQREGGKLLAACGIYLREKRLVATCEVMPVPQLVAAGVPVPPGLSNNWVKTVSNAVFSIEPTHAVQLNVVIFYHTQIPSSSVRDVYKKIRDRVNQFESHYVFSHQPPVLIETDENQPHWEAVSNYFSPTNRSSPKENIFVLDFCKPHSFFDPAYPVVKQILTASGYLSQFVNFNTHRHDQAGRDPRGPRKSDMILQSVARQILQKTGVRLWWVSLPRELPLPALFVGVDVFHAPKVFDPQLNRRVARPSCAAVIVQVVRPDSAQRHTVEIYSETFARAAGQEFELRHAISRAISNALYFLNVDPRSCIVWRDGVGDGAFDRLAQEEITSVRDGLARRRPPSAVAAAAAKVEATSAKLDGSSTPIAYVVCQKGIKTKFLTKDLENHEDGKYAAPPGTLVEGIQGLYYDTFYVQGRAPPGSTAKPVRYVIVEKDESILNLSLPGLTWDLCHDYPNWTGSIKVPSVTMMAHKLAELAGAMRNSGEDINHRALQNTIHFL